MDTLERLVKEEIESEGGKGWFLTPGEGREAAAELEHLRLIEEAARRFVEGVRTERKAYYRKISQVSIDQLAAALNRKP
jgi:hypothetical protein